MSTNKVEINNSEKSVKVTETKYRELEISNRVYIVPAGVVKFIEELTEEVQRQQERKEISDLKLDEKINGRIRRMLLELDQHGMLATSLDTEYPLPSGVSSTSGKWTFYDAALKVARNGLRNKGGGDLMDELEPPKVVRRETV